MPERLYQENRQYQFWASCPPLPPTATDQTDPPSLQNGQLVLSTTTGAQNAGQTAPTTQRVPSHPSHTSNSTTDFAIRLFKPQPTRGAAVILPPIETHVHLDINLPSGSWDALQLPLTKSVTSDHSSNMGGYIKPLLLLIIVRGATTRQEYTCVCGQCGKRTGNTIGSPSLIDFHSSSNIITPKDGTIQVHFTFSCYSRHHQKQDQEYVLEVILKDVSNPSRSIEVARKELPYSFDDQTQQADICNPCGAAKRPGSAVTIQSEDGSFGISALRISPASSASAQPISDGNTRRAQSCDTPNNIGQQKPSTHCASLMRPPVPCGLPHIPTDAEMARARARIAEREVQINALEVKIRDLKATFEAESRQKYIAIKDHFDSRILVIQKEITDRLNDVLTRTPGSGSDRHRQVEEVGFSLPCPEARALGIQYSS